MTVHPLVDRYGEDLADHRRLTPAEAEASYEASGHLVADALDWAAAATPAELGDDLLEAIVQRYRSSRRYTTVVDDIAEGLS